MLFISHDLGVVRHIADRIAVMYLGQIIEVADRDAFFAGPAHPYSEALLSSVPTVDREPRRERIELRGRAARPGRPAARLRASTPAAGTRSPPAAPTRPSCAPVSGGRLVRCHLPLLEGVTTS